MNNKRTEPKGQIIVILAIAIVALLGITALAVDGSLIYNDRRTDQSTADSAALAGAGAAAQILKEHDVLEMVCGKSIGTNATVAAYQAAIDSAMEDDVVLLRNDLSTKNGVKVTCMPDPFGQEYLDIRVMVTTDTQTTFARVISQDTIRTTVESTARVYPKQAFGGKNGLLSTSPNCGNNVGGIEFSGNSSTTVNLAGVFSNSCIKATSGSTIVLVTGGPKVRYVTTCDGCKGADISPVPEKAPEKMPEIKLDPPKCTTAAYKAAATSGNINPGNYYGINAANNSTLKLKPGLYCIKGNMTNGSKSILTGEKVTLYFITGDIAINQNDDGLVMLTAPDCETADATCGVPPAIRGILMYLDPDHPHDVTLNGGATNIFEGTIFGPNANFKINGGSFADTFKTQIIGNYIYISGGSFLNMNLDGAEIYQSPSSIDLLK